MSIQEMKNIAGVTGAQKVSDTSSVNMDGKFTFIFGCNIRNVTGWDAARSLVKSLQGNFGFSVYTKSTDGKKIELMNPAKLFFVKQ